MLLHFEKQQRYIYFLLVYSVFIYGNHLCAILPDLGIALGNELICNHNTHLL